MERQKSEHFLRNVMGELLNLFSDVLEEGVARPSTDKHNHINWDLSQVHLHGGSGTEGVRSDFGCRETKLIGSDSRDSCPQSCRDHF